MNDLEFLASFRDEVPVPATSPIERSVMTAIRARTADDPARAARPWRLAVSRWPRPVLAGALAAVLAVSAFAFVALSGHRDYPVGSRVVAWSGKPTAAWPAGPSYGRASTEAQLIAYVTRAAAAAPGRPPKPNEWVVVKAEYADNFKISNGNSAFGAPDKLKVSLKWHRFGHHCAEASVPDFPASTPPGAVVSGKLTIDYNVAAAGCDDPGVRLDGWKSVRYGYLSSLPTNPAALESVMLAAERPLGHQTRDEAIYDSINSLLTSGVFDGYILPPRLLASLYRVLRQLPGVHFDAATDLVGRTGLGFWMIQEGYLKEEIVIDPVTYAPMGFKDVAIKDRTEVGSDVTMHVHKGDVESWLAMLGTRIVRHPGQLP